jgi:lipopolysaccharide transport system ATP-binding protein
LGQSEVCVSVKNVSKKFARSLKRSFIYGAKDIGALVHRSAKSDTLRESEFWAVKDVSFELLRGKSIGIVGLNGSGKTTLLRMVSGILSPTVGDIAVNGRIAPMLALGAGFKPVLSGRENIFLNLSLLGVSERDIKARYDSIVDFSELQEAIEAPIGTYSSGMLARLGFACAVHTDPQILIVDEVLSVGDSRFRVKCRNRINELRRAGTSMLLVSHSAIMIETLSDECIFMRKGKVVAQGAPAQVLKLYEQDGIEVASSRNAAAETKRAVRNLTASQPLEIVKVSISLGNGGNEGYLCSGQPGEFVFKLKTSVFQNEVSVNLMVFDLTHQPGESIQFIVSSRDIGRISMQPGESTVTIGMAHVGLRPGTYRLKLSVSQGQMHDILDVVDNVRLVVRDVIRNPGSSYYQPREWKLNGAIVSSPPEQAEPDENDDSTNEDF